MRKFSNLVLVASLMFAFFASTASAMEWVYGNVDRLDEFTGFDATYYTGSTGGWYPDPRPYGILITLTNKQWDSAGSAGSLNCTNRFRLVEGEQGITAETRKRMFAMLLTAYTTGTRVGLYVDTTPSNTHMCTMMAILLGKSL